MTKKKVLLLCGGRSDEHEISLISAKCILDALDRTQFEPVLVGITKEGTWLLENEKEFYLGEFRADKISLNLSAPKITLAPYSVNRQGVLLCESKEFKFDVVFPILHGPFGEDGTIQGLFELMNLPFVGAGCQASAMARDKAVTKTLCKFHNIPTTEFIILNSLMELSSKKTEILKMGFPLFIKPARTGSSVGISKVEKASDLNSAIESVFKFDTKCLIEKGLAAREIECAVLGLTQNAKVANPGEILPNPKIGWYTYEAKYLLPDGAETVTPANLSPDQTKAAQDLALRVFQMLECRGMARVDLFLEKATGKFFLNEINTIPGFTPISMYPKMWQSSGMSYQKLITELIQLALLR